MTGPEHYKVAETLLGNLRRELSGINAGLPLHTPDQQDRMIAEAQVHATLALTWATSEGRLTWTRESESATYSEDSAAWAKAAS